MTSIATIERRRGPGTRVHAQPPLPYGSVTLRVARPLRRGFRILDRMLVPALRAGLGIVLSNPCSGYLMVLRTRGRLTGRVRDVPVAYVIVDGALYFCAGFGVGTSWYRNLLANPHVEITLPGRTLAGVATPVTDPGEWTRSYRALIGSLRVLGRLTVGDIRQLDDAALLSLHGGIPMLRLWPSSLVSGPLDPGGRFWLLPYGTSAIAMGAIAFRRWRGR
jgi:deazaflavin-dependent oxidoreductase (nitroreductase family)